MQKDQRQTTHVGTPSSDGCSRIERELVSRRSVGSEHSIPRKVFYMTAPRFLIVALAATVLVCFAEASTPNSLAQSSSAQAPDNSGQNKNHADTADNQTNAKEDRQITAKIRKAIVAEKDLSTYAHNIKIVTVHGEVTLKGAVQTGDEKQKIVSLASTIVPAEKIVNDLTVKQ
jgi:osmotically-inducible protein OsmY